ncbi:DoxX family protein [Flavobacterium ajazii]|uniref:DoxX family protein n=1 Tax=Flavobacterium ajazii TaxID=2692318 RepID=UPI0013CF448D|nr:DoxX family protein [Flavobacterium ajazii]
MSKKILTGLYILTGLMLANSGFNKFFHYMPLPQMSEELTKAFGSIMSVKWILPLTGIVEIIGGVLLVFPKSRALGAIVLLPVLVGIVCHHLAYDAVGGMVAYILFAVVVWAIVTNADKYKPMIK